MAAVCICIFAGSSTGGLRHPCLGVEGVLDVCVLSFVMAFVTNRSPVAPLNITA